MIPEFLIWTCLAHRTLLVPWTQHICHKSKPPRDQLASVSYNFTDVSQECYRRGALFFLFEVFLAYQQGVGLSVSFIASNLTGLGFWLVSRPIESADEKECTIATVSQGMSPCNEQAGVTIDFAWQDWPSTTTDN